MGPAATVKPELTASATTGNIQDNCADTQISVLKSETTLFGYNRNRTILLAWQGWLVLVYVASHYHTPHDNPMD